MSIIAAGYFGQMRAFKCVCVYRNTWRGFGSVGLSGTLSAKAPTRHRLSIKRSRGERVCVHLLMPLSIGCSYGPPICPLAHTGGRKTELLHQSTTTHRMSKFWILYPIYHLGVKYYEKYTLNVPFIDWLICWCDSWGICIKIPLTTSIEGRANFKVNKVVNEKDQNQFRVHLHTRLRKNVGGKFRKTTPPFT